MLSDVCDCECSVYSHSDIEKIVGLVFPMPSLTIVPKISNPPKISLPDMISQIFPSKFQQIHIITVSGGCVPFTLKIYQTVVGISMISQFHEFF